MVARKDGKPQAKAFVWSDHNKARAFEAFILYTDNASFALLAPKISDYVGDNCNLGSVNNLRSNTRQKVNKLNGGSLPEPHLAFGRNGPSNDSSDSVATTPKTPRTSKTPRTAKPKGVMKDEPVDDDQDLSTLTPSEKPKAQRKKAQPRKPKEVPTPSKTLGLQTDREDAPSSPASSTGEVIDTPRTRGIKRNYADISSPQDETLLNGDAGQKNDEDSDDANWSPSDAAHTANDMDVETEV